jgi:acyl homoserine lactone synthase
VDPFVSTFAPSNTPTSHLEAMFRLRYEVFHEKLGWDVQVVDGMERDHFDDVEQITYILAIGNSQSVDACWRLLPSTGPYMLKDTFPELLHGEMAPEASNVWELSRFAVATSRTATDIATFGPISMALMKESARFALERGITRYVTVTTPPMERMLRRQGLHVHRFGPSIRYGVAAAVALIIEIDHQTLDAVGLEPPAPQSSH